ncbi:MAG: protein jag [Deltaproteobacteria bacterium]|nr:protein jag [Deltaproteobacteria bacterium]
MAAEYEFEGKTKEEALQTACKELGLSENQLQVEVLSYGSTGIFGLVGVKKARIKVVIPKKHQTPPEQPVSPAEDADAKEDISGTASEALKTLVSFIVDDATVTARNTADAVKLTIEADNSALLIGKHGRTLDALQYLVQKIVYQDKKTKKRIVVDVEGYRERRKASLTQLALRLGEKVKRSGKPATISPMNAYDRRIIHVALKDESRVRTQSMGSGALRKLVIYPQKKQKKQGASV